MITENNNKLITLELLKGQLITNCENNNLSRVKFLIQQGVDISFYNELPLRRACINGHLKIIKYLIKQGANPHVLNDDPLIMASVREKTNSNVIRYLLSLESKIYWLTHSNPRIREIYEKFRKPIT